MQIVQCHLQNKRLPFPYMQVNLGTYILRTHIFSNLSQQQNNDCVLLGWNHRGVYILSRNKTLKTKIKRKLSPGAHHRLRMDYHRFNTKNKDYLSEIETFLIVFQISEYNSLRTLNILRCGQIEISSTQKNFTWFIQSSNSSIHEQKTSQKPQIVGLMILLKNSFYYHVQSVPFENF